MPRIQRGTLEPGTTFAHFLSGITCSTAHWLDLVVRVLLIGKLFFLKIKCFDNKIKIEL